MLLNVLGSFRYRPHPDHPRPRHHPPQRGHLSRGERLKQHRRQGLRRVQPSLLQRALLQGMYYTTTRPPARYVLYYNAPSCKVCIIHLLYTFLTIFTPIYTLYTCIYTICTSYVHHMYIIYTSYIHLLTHYIHPVQGVCSGRGAMLAQNRRLPTCGASEYYSVCPYRSAPEL
jgi:hypothetical protein